MPAIPDLITHRVRAALCAAALAGLAALAVTARRPRRPPGPRPFQIVPTAPALIDELHPAPTPRRRQEGPLWLTS